MSTKNTLKIFDLFDEENRHLTVAQIAKKLNKPQSSVYRYVRVLRENNFLREKENGYYSLGYKFLKYYRIVKMDVDLSSIAEKHMVQLTNDFSETTMLLVYSNLQAVCLYTVNSNERVKVAGEPGEIIPLYAGGSSKALLAYLDEKILIQLYEQENIKQFTNQTIVEFEHMKKHLNIVRKNGYAYSNGELHEGVISYGVPIFNSSQEVIASLSITGLENRFQKISEPDVVNRLKETARKIQEYF